MFFSSWLRNRTTTPRANRAAALRQRPARFRPALEMLEDRWVPSTLTVTNTLDSGAGSLRAAVAIANAAKTSDTIVFAPSLNGQTITLTSGELLITSDVTIAGPGAANLTISGNHSSRVFELNNKAKTHLPQVSLSGVTISNGDGQIGGIGGAINNYGTLTISNCTLGGPLFANFAKNGGGAIANFGTMAIAGCDVFDNRANDGGGIYNAGTMTVTGGHVSANSASEFGGGIDNLATLTVNSSTLAYNSATDGGGIYNAGTATVSGGSVSYNSAVYDGGGIYNVGTLAVDGSGRHMTVSDCAITGNSADDGGGIYNDAGGTATVSNCQLSSNICYSEGGGIYNAGAASALTVSNSTFSGNTDGPSGSPDNIFGPYTDGGGNSFS